MAQASHSVPPFLKAVIKRFVMVGVTWAAIVTCFIVTIMGFGLFGLITMFSSPEAMSSNPFSYSPIYGSGYNSLLSIKVSGPITGSDQGSLGPFADVSASGYYIKQQLQAAADDDSIKGVILEVSSPGGTIYGARAIADGVTYYKEHTGKPVYAYVEGLAASGGYWAIAPTDKIIADYGSDVGSIGVIMGPFQYYDGVIAEDGGLLGGGIVTQNGIESTYFTAGTSKDMGSPYRRLTPSEVQNLQQAVNNEYENFVAYVAEHRKISAETIKDTIGALAYDNKSALELKLIDNTGSRDAAYAELAKAAGIEDDYQIVQEDYIPTFLETILFTLTGKPNKHAQSQKQFDTCSLTRSTLAYHGDVTRLCNK